MNNSPDTKIFEEAVDWVNSNKKIVLVTVIQAWGSSPREVGSKMIVDQKGNFSGSISGGCVESSVIRECIQLLNSDKLFEKLDFKVSNQTAWEIGLACGGEISVYLEQIKK